ncbi:polyprenyl synthetase family protein [Streptomyces sp. NPDC056716]|uniref:polyprenyl synthetase family protein n=1 Tax=unclassified Streptomyces TaxID=2593676 RepID=UPI003681949D
MTTSTVPAEHHGLDHDRIRAEVDAVLSAFLRHKARTAAGQKLPTEVTTVLRDFLAVGGKRIRPLLCVTGWHAAGGKNRPHALVQAAASLEMFHAFCLIHDDIMDNSATRRGQPAVHRTLASHHGQGRTTSAADRLGKSAAVLVGDIALAWSDELLHTAGLDTRRLGEVLPLVDAMRTEVMYGQYLDVTAAGTPTDDIERALAICRYKTAKYTIERPLHIGAALAGADQRLLDTLSAFALPLGEAFQLRDDLLGVFGDPRRTGKPTLDDLRDGKHTVLIAHAMRHADEARRQILRTLLGNPHLDESAADHLRRILTAVGAPAAVEDMIRERHDAARHAIESGSIPAGTAALLLDMARQATARTT